jgi:hypothetical protein
VSEEKGFSAEFLRALNISKDAEIERLKEENSSMENQLVEYAGQMLEDAAEIKRLKGTGGMNFEQWRDTHWKWGSSTDEAKALRAWNSAREEQDTEIKDLREANLNLAKGGSDLLEAIEGFKAEIQRLTEQLQDAGASAEQRLEDHYVKELRSTGRCPFCGAQD